MRYEIEITKNASRELAELPEGIVERADNKILSLAEEPRPKQSKKLKGSFDTHRLRVGDYRIVYFINDVKRIVRVLAIKHRKDAYRSKQ